MESTNLYNKEGKELSIDEIIATLPFLVSLDKTNRVEVIDSKGRSYVSRFPYNSVEISFQDKGKTLKIFIYEHEKVLKEGLFQVLTILSEGK